MTDTYDLESVVKRLVEKLREEGRVKPMADLKTRTTELMRDIIASGDNLDGFADQVLDTLSELSGEPIPEMREFTIEVEAQATMRGFATVKAYDEDHARQVFEDEGLDEVEWRDTDDPNIDRQTVEIVGVDETAN